MNVTALIIAALLVGTTPEEFADYDQKIPGTPFAFPMVAVRGGDVWRRSFTPGELNSGAENRTKYTVSDFYIGKYEVRYGEFRSWEEDVSDNLAAQRPYDRNGECGVIHNLTDNRPDSRRYPASGMNHWAAKRYCHWLSVKTGRFYRLPTEAEWEYACRGGGDPRAYFPWGDNPDRLPEFAVMTPFLPYDAAHRPCCAVPGTKKPNGYGIYDMIGNLEEWVADSYDAYGRGSGTSGSKTDPVEWPLGDKWFKDLDAVRQQMDKEEIRFSNSEGATKGGSGFGARSRSPRSFGVSARFNPTRFADNASLDEPSVPERFPRWPVGVAVGLRVCRPVRVPSRREQLWHWGLYLDHDRWIDTTLAPSEPAAAKKPSAE